MKEIAHTPGFIKFFRSLQMKYVKSSILARQPPPFQSSRTRAYPPQYNLDLEPIYEVIIPPLMIFKGCIFQVALVYRQLDSTPSTPAFLFYFFHRGQLSNN